MGGKIRFKGVLQLGRSEGVTDIVLVRKDRI